MIEILDTHKADFKILGPNENSLLHLSTKNDCVWPIVYYRDRINLDSRDVMGRTPLLSAIEN